MSDFMKSLKDAVSGAADIAKDLAAAMGEKAKDFAGDAGDKARALSRIAKLKLEIGAENERASEAYREIGRLYFERADKLSVPSEYVRHFDQALLANSNREAMEAELKELSAQFAESCECDVTDFEDVVAKSEADCGCTVELRLDGDDAGIEVEITDETPETPED